MLILNVFTSANLILLFCLLFFRKNNVLPNKILALTLVNPGINFISNINTLLGYQFDFPYLYFFAQCTMFGFAPLVHMYVTLLLGKKINRKYPVYYISLLCTLMVVYFAAEFMMRSPAEQFQYMSGVMEGPYPEEMNIANGLFILLQQVYFTISLIDVIRYKRRLNNTMSNFGRTKLSYVVRFITLIWILNLSTILLYITQPTIHVEYIYLPIVLTCIYFFILYYAFHYHSIFTAETYADLVSGTLAAEKQVAVPAERQQLPEQEALARKIEVLMQDKKIFTNPDLTINDLSGELGVQVSKVSTCINKVFQKNFYDFINEKRIERSRSLLQELSKTHTIESIAYEAGFNSRASFYRAFKKYTGSTPSEFLHVSNQPGSTNEK